MATSPLTGIRVIDLTRILNGPFCTLILKNLGAEIIKVEHPQTGDEARHIGPFLDASKQKSAYFMSVNAGKKSLALDLKTEKGCQILSDLITRADVLVENFKPGVLKRLGFSESRLQSINPDLVYVSSSGFGYTGPDSPKPAFDMVIQALSGIISITGTSDGQTTRVGTSISDIIAGMFSAIGVLSALYRRSVTHTGARIDIAMLDSTVAILENAIARFQVDQTDPTPLGTRHPSITPFGSFKTRDGEIIIAAGTDKIFHRLCDFLGLSELKTDARFTNNEQRTQHAVPLKQILETKLALETAAAWLQKLAQAGIPSSRVNRISDLFEYEQISARNMLIPVDNEEGFKVAGNPIKFGDVSDQTSAGRMPALGEHNEEILTHILEYSQTEIDELYQKDIIAKHLSA